MSDIATDRFNDPAVKGLAQKVDYRIDPEVSGEFGIGSGTVELRTTTGGKFSRHIEHAYGHPQNPISKEDLILKFRECISFSIRPVPDEDIN